MLASKSAYAGPVDVVIDQKADGGPAVVHARRSGGSSPQKPIAIGVLTVMRASKSTEHDVPILEPGDLVNAVQALLKSESIAVDDVTFRRRSRTSDGISFEQTTSWNDLWSVTDLSTIGDLVISWGDAHVALRGIYRGVSLSAGSRDIAKANRLHRELRDALHLKKYPYALPTASGDPTKVSSSVGDAPVHKALDLPPRVTLRWLIDHVPVHIWLLFLSMIISALLAGAAIGQTTVARELLVGLGHWSK